MDRSTTVMTASLALLLALTMTVSAENSGADLDFKITNIKNSKGKLVIALFDSSDDFLEKPVAEFSLDINEDGEVLGTFADLPPGDYGIAAYHDKNDDGKLNTFVLVPREDYGFSNNARSFFGPPSFKKSSFILGEEDMAIEFKVK